MPDMHEYLATVPFDLYELYLFHLVAKHRSFTKAAELAGVTQSAITRQMQGMENSLGIDLMERTTRSVRLTAAGEFLLAESARLLGNVEATLDRLKVEFGGARKEVRVGVSQSVGLAYLPGFFHANLRRLPEVACRVRYQPSGEILQAVESHDLDLGVLCPPKRLSKTLMVTHRFTDTFTLIAPAAAGAPAATTAARRKWLDAQSWLLLADSTNTGQRLRAWLKREGLTVSPTMELENFDLIINLVALGMGASFVPQRALALYGSKHSLHRIRWPRRFERELVVVVRRHRKLPVHLERFVANILF